MSREKQSTFVDVQFSLKVCEVKNPVILPSKQGQTEVTDVANNCTPTKGSKPEDKQSQKTSPKKENKEEKKEGKLQPKKSFSRKSEVLSGPHQMHQGDEPREIFAEDVVADEQVVDFDKE